MHRNRQLILDKRLGIVRPAIEELPKLSSTDAPWEGIMIEQHAPPGPREFTRVAPVDDFLVVQLRGAAELEVAEDGRTQKTVMRPGDFTLFPAGVEFNLQSPNLGEYMAVTLTPAFLRRAAHDLCAGVDGPQLQPRYSQQDPLLHGIALSLKREIQEGFSGGKTYGESLGVALAVHLAHCHSASGLVLPPPTNGLTRNQLQRAIDFVQAHLTQDLSLHRIAAEVGLSPFHFARLFKQTTQLSPHQYVIKCRVERARELLQAGHDTAADVAVQVGFCDQSHLTVHFKRLLGVTPKEYRRRLF